MKLKNITIALFSLFLASCAGELSRDEALKIIADQDEFQMPVYAPLHLAPEVLTGENQKEPQKYIDNKFGQLIDQGLIVARLGGSNSWRTILTMELTEKGRAMDDPSRTEDDMFYVQTCKAVADSIIELTTLGKDTILCHYQITQRNITPFGEYLGFAEGRTHKHERKFVKGTFSWTLLPI